MSAVRRLALASLWGLAVSLPLVAGAQVYRIVGPDGRVTYSDRPPPQQAGKPAPAPQGPGAVAAAPGAATAALPFELRNVASRYPVTLYTGADCIPCVSGRNYLASRGIPYSERTISTADDVEALKRLTGQNRVPMLTIGGQQLAGFSESEWSQFLDAAGYPRESRLPAGWRNAPATPLVTAQPAAVPTPPPAQQAEAPAAPQAPLAPAPAGPSPSNPAGIRF